MELHQIRCFVAVAEDLHFGRAAQRLDVLPAALGRHIRLLEEALGTRLLVRTTRHVALTDDGAVFLEEAHTLLAQADRMAARFREQGSAGTPILRIEAIDSAAAGLVPLLLHDFRRRCPDVTVRLLEDKTIRLLPRLVSGRLDLAFVRPPHHTDRRLEILLLFHESAIVAVPAGHALATRDRICIEDLAEQPLIVPERRTRPHSHDLTIKLFAEAGLQPRIAQVAEEKHTIVSLVAADIGVAIVPRWAARMGVPGVRYIPLDSPDSAPMKRLPLAAAWVRGTRDCVRDAMVDTVQRGLAVYAEQA